MDQPIVLTTRTLLAILVAAVILSAGIAFAAATFSQPQLADAQVAKASSEVTELKRVNRTLSTVDRTLSTISRSIGLYDYSGSSLRKNTKDTEDQVHKLCLAVAQYSYQC